MATGILTISDPNLTPAEMYDIKYSMGQLRDLDTPPHVSDNRGCTVSPSQKG